MKLAYLSELIGIFHVTHLGSLDPIHVLKSHNQNTTQLIWVANVVPINFMGCSSILKVLQRPMILSICTLERYYPVPPYNSLCHFILISHECWQIYSHLMW